MDNKILFMGTKYIDRGTNPKIVPTSVAYDKRIASKLFKEFKEISELQIGGKYPNMLTSNINKQCVLLSAKNRYDYTAIGFRIIDSDTLEIARFVQDSSKKILKDQKCSVYTMKLDDLSKKVKESLIKMLKVTSRFPEVKPCSPQALHKRFAHLIKKVL